MQNLQNKFQKSTSTRAKRCLLTGLSNALIPHLITGLSSAPIPLQEGSILDQTSVPHKVIFLKPLVRYLRAITMLGFRKSQLEKKTWIV